MTAIPTAEIQVDEGLYSRQLYAIGHDAMRNMHNKRVLIGGMRGLGVAVAKNIILTGGIKEVTLWDEGFVEWVDLSSNYYAKEDDIGKNRCHAVVEQLQELNRYVTVTIHAGELTPKIIQEYHVVVLTNSVMAEWQRVNSVTHAQGITFIGCNTYGLCTRLFNDFCTFTSQDVNGEKLKTTIVVNIDVDGLVQCVESQSHDLENGDWVTFKGVEGLPINDRDFEIQYVDKWRFRIKLPEGCDGEYQKGGEVSQKKMPMTIEFKSLEESLKDPDMVLDFSHMERPGIMHDAMMAREKEPVDYGAFRKLLKVEYPDDLLERFHMTANGQLCPMDSFMGGIVAQEIVKACGLKFLPFRQWFYFDRLECLADDYKTANRDALKCRYDGQIAVFGQEFQDAMAKLHYFVVGCGAIGCDLLKNFATMGVGRLTCTDMDTIERSNLSRQFLFRNKDIGSPKSTTAAAAIRKMNPLVNITAHNNRVGAETECVYDRTFYSSISGVANALDNVEARMYMDNVCLLRKVPLLESGTLGTKGNTQVVVPFLTETYGSSRDPPEKEIPLCTLKNFPSQPEHVIQYWRDQFDGMFNKNIANLMTFLGGTEEYDKMTTSEKGIFLDSVMAATFHVPMSFEECLGSGYVIWHIQFRDEINNILKQFPADHKTEEGVAFWSGSKKCPHPLVFDTENPFHVDFVFSFACIWAHIFGLEITMTREEAVQQMMTMKPPDANATGCVVGANDADEASLSKTDKSDDELVYMMKQIKMILPKNVTIRGKPEEFEKDDDNNHHIDFITAAANLRAQNYGIDGFSRLTTKGIAGKIIPALATTTDVIASLSSMELYKLAQGFKKVDVYRNNFVNLAMAMVTSSDPIEAPGTMFRGKKYTMWDQYTLEGVEFIRDLISFFKKEFDLNVDTVMHGTATLCSPWMPADKRERRMETSIKKILNDELRANVTDDAYLTVSLDFTEDPEVDDDFELPPVRIVFAENS